MYKDNVQKKTDETLTLDLEELGIIPKKPHMTAQEKRTRRIKKDTQLQSSRKKKKKPPADPNPSNF